MTKEWWKHPVAWVAGAVVIFGIVANNQPKPTLQEIDKAAVERATRAGCRDFKDNAGPWPYMTAERRETMAKVCRND